LSLRNAFSSVARINDSASSVDADATSLVGNARSVQAFVRSIADGRNVVVASSCGVAQILSARISVTADNK